MALILSYSVILPRRFFSGKRTQQSRKLEGQEKNRNIFIRPQEMTKPSVTFMALVCCLVEATHIQCESKKKSSLRGPDISHFPHKRLRIFNRFFTHLLYIHIYARLQIFIQLSPSLTKLCHIKRDYAVHIIRAKCPKCAKTRAFRRLRKSFIALLIVVFGK